VLRGAPHRLAFCVGNEPVSNFRMVERCVVTASAAPLAQPAATGGARSSSHALSPCVRAQALLQGSVAEELRLHVPLLVRGRPASVSAASEPSLTSVHGPLVRLCSIPNSTNTWEAIYEVPEMSEAEKNEILSSPFESRSDSFYFVDDKLIMHTKAEYGYEQ